MRKTKGFINKKKAFQQDKKYQVSGSKYLETNRGKRKLNKCYQ